MIQWEAAQWLRRPASPAPRSTLLCDLGKVTSPSWISVLLSISEWGSYPSSICRKKHSETVLILTLRVPNSIIWYRVDPYPLLFFTLCSFLLSAFHVFLELPLETTQENSKNPIGIWAKSTDNNHLPLLNVFSPILAPPHSQRPVSNGVGMWVGSGTWE